MLKEGTMHSSEEFLSKKLIDAKDDIVVGGIYAHYKDVTKTYEVCLLSIAESDEALQVVYKARYGKQLTFVRPLASWVEDVEVDGQRVKRFRHIE
jgi:hypothetical protein